MRAVPEATRTQNNIINRQNSNTRDTNTTSNVVPPRPNPITNTNNQPRQFLPPPPVNRPQNVNVRSTAITGDSDDNNVLCGCNNPAVLLTVRKQTANFGEYI